MISQWRFECVLMGKPPINRDMSIAMLHCQRVIGIWMRLKMKHSSINKCDFSCGYYRDIMEYTTTIKCSWVCVCVSKRWILLPNLFENNKQSADLGVPYLYIYIYIYPIYIYIYMCVCVRYIYIYVYLFSDNHRPPHIV